MGISPASETIASLARRVKSRYPAYKTVPDRELVKRILAKHPTYQTRLSRETLMEMAEETSKEMQRQTTEPAGTIETIKGIAKFIPQAIGNVASVAGEAYYGAKGFRDLREARFSEEQILEMQRRGAIGSLRPELWKQFVDPQMEQFEIAKEASQRGEYGQAAARAGLGALPVFGPMAAGVAETTAIHGRWAGIKQAAPLIAVGALARGAGAARARGAQLRTAPRPAPAPAPAPVPRLAPAPGRRALPPVRSPEIGIERELPAGGVVRPVPPPVEAAAPAVAPVAPAPAPGLPRRVGKGRTKRVKQPTPEEIRAQAAWKRVLEEEAPPPPAPVAKPLPKGVTEELVQAELSAMNRRGQEFRQPTQRATAIGNVQRMQAREVEAAPRSLEDAARAGRAQAEAAFREGQRRGREKFGPLKPLTREQIEAIAKKEKPPEPQPIAPREAAELGVAPERVLEVLRRQREAEAVTARAVERQPPRPSAIVKEPAKRTAVDEFGDVIEPGGRVVDSLGRSGKVRSVGALVQDLETGKAVFRADTLKVDFGKGPEPVSISEVTVKRHGRPKALEGIGRKPVRHFGESEEAFGARMRERGFIRGKDLLPEEWLESLGDIGRGIKDIITRSKTKTKTVSPESPELNEARIKVGRQFEKRQQELKAELDKAGETILGRVETIRATGTIQPKGIRPEVAYRGRGQNAVKVSPNLMRKINAEIITAGRELINLRNLAEKSADRGTINQLAVATQRFEAAKTAWQQARASWARTGHTLQREVLDYMLQELGETGRSVKSGARIPIMLDVRNILREWRKGELGTGKAAQGLIKDLIQYLRINLFSIGSPTLDMFTNSLHSVIATAGAFGGDMFALVGRGEMGFVRTAGLLRAIRTGKGFHRMSPEMESRLGRTVGGEQLSTEGRFEPLGFRRVAGVKKGTKTGVALDAVEHIINLPLWGKQSVDTFFKRTWAAATLYARAAEVANSRGLRGIQREAFIQDFLKNPPDWAFENAVKEGNRAGFNRELSKLEESIARSGWVQVLMQAYPRWAFQFSRWMAEMLGARPKLWNRIRKGQASGEEIATYLAEAATGWGAIYLIEGLYQNTDFNSMEYVHANGDRTRFSGRTPIPEGLMLLAIIHGDKEKAMAALQYTSFPGAQGTEGGLVGGLANAFRDVHTKQIDTRQFSREMTNMVNRALPGQAVMRAVNSIFDPTMREGVGAYIPGYAQTLPKRISATTGEPLQPRERVFGTPLEIGSGGGIPLPGSRRLLDPVAKVLLNHGIGIFRPRRTPIAEFPVEGVPPELRQQYERIRGRLVNQYVTAETQNPYFEQLEFEERRKILQKAVSQAQADAKLELEAGRGFPEKPLRVPTLREKLLPEKLAPAPGLRRQ